MKLSNNAIKFLMAHYRAIYKHAFFKGLTTATLLTIGLSAAQGALAAKDANLEADDTLPKTENSILTVDGQATQDWDTKGIYKNIQISKDAAKDAFKDYTIKITGGAASTDGTANNFIAGSAAATNFIAKQLIIDTKDDAQGLTVRAANSQVANATFNKVEVKSGLLQVNTADTGFGATISANTIDVGTMPAAQEPNAPQAKAKTEVAKVVVGKNGAFGTAIAAKKLSELTTLNIGTNGVVSSATPNGAALTDVNVNAAELNLKGGTLQAVSDNGKTNGSTMTVNIVKGALDSGSIKVEKASTANITFSDEKVTDDNTKEIDKTFALKGGKLDVAGTLAFSGAGLVSLAKETEIAGSGDLKFIETNLQADVNTLAAAAGKAKVSLDSGNLVLTDDSVDLSQLTITDQADGKGKIGVTNNTNLKAKNELIVKADNAQLGSLEARKLVLGDKNDATFAKGLKANDSVTLMGKVTVKELTLDNGFAEINKAKGAKVTAQDLLGATPGSIESQVGDAGELVVDDSAAPAKLTIANGSWVGNTKLTLGGATQQGNLVIGATDQSNKTAAKLELGENAKLVMTSGDITIGNTTPKSLISAELDLSNLDKEALTLDKGAIKIQDKGTLVANQDFVEALTSSAKTGVSLTIGSSGVFDVKGEVALDAKKDFAAASATAKQIYFNGKAGQLATLRAEDITLNKADTFALGANNKIEANNLTLSGDSEVKLGAGEYLVHESLQSGKSEIKAITLSGSNLTLATKNAKDQGSVQLNLVVGEGATGSNVSFTKGTWNLQDAKLVSGNLVVGDTDANVVLSSNGLLTVGDKGTAKVLAGSEATFAKLDQAHNTTKADNIEVKGKLKIEGVTPAAGEAKEFGFKTAASSQIKVDGSEAVLSIGEKALGALEGFKVENGDVKYADGITDPFAGTVVLANYGTLSLEFAPETTFTLDQIKALRKEFTGSADAAQNGFIKFNQAKISGLNVDKDQNGNYEIGYDKLSQAGDISDLVLDNLSEAKVTGVSGVVSSNVGSLQLKDAGATATIGKATLNNAVADSTGAKQFAVDKDGKAANITVNANGSLGLNNGGNAKDITLTNGNDAKNLTTLVVKGNGQETVINALKGEANTKFIVSNGKTTISTKAAIGSLETLDGSTLVVKDKLDVTGTQKTELKGSLEAKKASFAGDLDVLAKATFAEGLTANGAVAIKADTEVKAGTADLQKGAVLSNGASLTAEQVKVGSNQLLAVGQDYTEEQLQQDPTLNGSATLVAKKLQLNDGTLVVDPSYNQAYSLASVEKFNDTGVSVNDDAGYANGNLVVGQNAVLAIGKNTNEQNARAFANNFLSSNGKSLDKDKVGALAIVNSKLTLASGKHLVVDAHGTKATMLTTGNALAAKYNSGDLYLGANSVLGISDSIFTDVNADGTAIHFDKEGAAIYVADATSKVVLEGNQFLNSRTFNLFTDKKGNTAGDTEGVMILNHDLEVETLNGLMHITYKKDKDTSAQKLEFNTSKVNEAYTQASAPVREYLISYATGVQNWQDAYADKLNGTTSTNSVAAIPLVGAQAGSMATAVENQGAWTVNLSQEAKDAGYTQYDFILVDATDKDGKPTKEAYFVANNSFLEKVVRNSDGSAAEKASRLGAFAGSMQAALAVNEASYKSINARMGMGGFNTALSQADNAQGSTIWVNPIYTNQESDGFGAQGVNYGTDLSLYGLALGGDATLDNGMILGAMLNVGAGDVDGKDAASGVSNDIKYYGFSFYTGYEFNGFSILADAGYSMVYNDVEANTQVGKLNAKYDSTSINAGIAAQYNMDVAGVNVLPHAAVRYSYVDMDGFDLKDEGVVFGSVDGTDANVFSIPVGITLSKDIVAGTWTVKPSLDLTVACNFGDDSLESKVNYLGVANKDLSTDTEFVDSFTYGATMGIAAQSGNVSLGLGVNYTGSSNVDQYGVNANARFVF